MKNLNIIIEDVLYFKEKKVDGEIINVSAAKDTFYYQFLMERSDDKIQGQNNLKAATNFYIYEQLFLYLFNRGYLTDKRFCIDLTEVPGGYCFTFDLGKAMKTIDIESELKEAFKGQHFDEYIETMCHPTDHLLCSCCSAISLSRHIAFSSKNGKETFCLACYPLEVEIWNELKNLYEKEGAVPTIKKRLEFVAEASKAKIASDKSIEWLLDEYKRIHMPQKPTARVKAIRKILDKNNLQDFEVFSTYDFDVVIWNRKKLYDYDVFSKAVKTNGAGAEILYIFNVNDACWLDDMAIEKVLCLMRSKKMKKNYDN